MKKALVLTLALIISLFAAIGLTACNDVELEVNFVVDGEVYDTITTAGNEMVKIPENPTKEGYTFDGWYLDEGVWEKPFTANSLLEAPLSSDMNVYAHWLPVTEPAHATHVDSITHHERIEADCTTDGNIEYWHCSVCCKNYSDANAKTEVSSVVIPAAHALTYYDRVESTCTADGNIEYWHCSGCGKNYSDANAKTEVSSVVITPAGHAASASTTVCTRCGLVSFDGLKFSLLSDGTYAVTDYTGSATSVVIPSTYENALVTSIGSSAFLRYSSLTSMTIPNGVTSIGYETFLGCSSLTSITIPNSVTSIGTAAFYNCSSLDKVYISDIARWCAISFGDACANPLYYAKKLYTVGNDTPITNLIIPEGVTSIGNYAFEYCSSFTSITIPNSVTTIGSSAFYGCSSLTSITIPNGVTFIARSAFEECSSLKSINIPSGVTAIGPYAFYNCTALIEINFNATAMNDLSSSNYVFSYAGRSGSGINVTIGKNVTKIPAYLFCPYSDSNSYAPKITSVEFEEGSVCTSIGNYAFRCCSSLTSITIPNSVTSIGSYAFSGCYKLVEVYNLSNLNITKGSSSNGFVGYYALDIYTSATATSKLHTTSDGYIFYEDGDTVYLVGYTGNSTTLNLPDKYNGKNYAIYQYAFYNNYNITSVTIGSGVTSIGDYAFSDCSSLTSITIPNSVTSIGSWAFGYCTALTEINFNATAMNDLSGNNYVFYKAGQSGSGIKVTIGKNVTKIPAYLFYPYSYYSTSDAPKITSVEFEVGSVCKSIGSYAFEGCKSLTSMNIPNSVTSIGSSAFYGCSSLEEITIPNGVTSIGYGAFYDCTALTEINFNATAMNNLSEYNYVFSYAGQSGSGIKVTIGKNVTKIPAYLFCPCYYDESYAPKITSVEFEEGSACTSIGYRAFYGCSSLTSITIPNSVTSIGSYAFSGCYKLVEVYNLSNLNITKGNEDYGYVGYYALDIYTSATATSKLHTTSDGYIFYENGNTVYLVGYPTNSTTLTLPDNYNGKNYAIYKYAFYEDDNITRVTIDSGVTSIGKYAFYNCSSLKEITIPNGVTSIGSYAFSGCSSLTSITIPNGVTSIGEEAFCNCTALTEINFNATAMNYLSENNYVFYKAGQSGSGIKVTIGKNVTKIPAYLFYPYSYYSNSDAPKITSVEFEVGSVCKSIGSYAFEGCKSLTSITIPSSVTSIGSWAFGYCSSLTSITIPNSVTSIGNYAFYGCSSLDEITIPNSVTSIGSSAFYNCSSFTSITIPNSVTSIGPGAFAYCSSLTSITIPNGVTSIGSSAFQNCTALTEINFNATAMNDLSEDNRVFSYAGQSGSGIKVTIGKNVTKIPAYLFYPYSSSSSAPNITSVEFEEGSVCTSIGAYAFCYCSSLTSVTFANTSDWWRLDSSTATSGTRISSTGLANTSTAATYLTSMYYYYYWKRG